MQVTKVQKFCSCSKAAAGPFPTFQTFGLISNFATSSTKLNILKRLKSSANGYIGKDCRRCFSIKTTIRQGLFQPFQHFFQKVGNSFLRFHFTANQTHPIHESFFLTTDILAKKCILRQTKTGPLKSRRKNAEKRMSCRNVCKIHFCKLLCLCSKTYQNHYQLPF